jgi:hypothetical protein
MGINIVVPVGMARQFLSPVILGSVISSVLPENPDSQITQVLPLINTQGVAFTVGKAIVLTVNIRGYREGLFSMDGYGNRLLRTCRKNSN